MFPNILSSQQHNLLPLLRSFTHRFYLAGGTAIALQIGHRRSVDFDLFTGDAIDSNAIIRALMARGYAVEHTMVDTSDELTVVIQSVKISFVQYPYVIQRDVCFENMVTMPDLFHLAAMKAYTLGRRAKWKDYVDLYQLMRDHTPFRDVVSMSRRIFGRAFNERLFREQLCYVNDVDFSETIDWMPEFAVDDQRIMEYLTDMATAND